MLNFYTHTYFYMNLYLNVHENVTYKIYILKLELT